MITIEKLGKNDYGIWCIFTYTENHLVINAIATTKLDNLKEKRTYANLKLAIHSKNGKTYYNILKIEE